MTTLHADILIDATPREADEPFELVVETSAGTGSKPIIVAYTSRTVFVDPFMGMARDVMDRMLLGTVDWWRID